MRPRYFPLACSISMTPPPRNDTCIPHTVAVVSDRSLSAAAVLYWAVLGRAGPGRAPFVPEQRGGGERA